MARLSDKSRLVAGGRHDADDRVEGYVVEGHVPASDIARLLEQRPRIVGLSVPGMPIGSPGMEGPNPEPYRVLSFDAQGRVEVFSSHSP